MKKNLPLIISVILNAVLLIMLGIYLFTPWLDYKVISKSLPRLCAYVEKSQPDLTLSFCQL